MSDRSRTPRQAGDDADEPQQQQDVQADSDDDIIHFPWQQGQILDSRYRVEDLLGDGAFGRVLRATDLQDEAGVSLKVIRDVERYRENAMIEAKILSDIREADPNRTSYCVMMSDTFVHRGVYFVMVCELLGDSLYDFLKWNGFRGFWLQDIQNFAKQSLKALKFLHDLSLTHTDLKPENILLQSREVALVSVFPRSEFQPPSDRYANLPYARPASNAIKLIDFGNATYVDMHHSSIIQTRQYRSPEVILQMGWSEKADIWSLGCILFELYTGSVLFDTHHSPEHLGLIDRILGPFPSTMLARAGDKAKKRFLAPSGKRLLWPEAAESPESERYVFQQWSLENRAPQDHQAFVAFVRDLLIHDPSMRPEAAVALSSEFFNQEYKE
ncbi:AFC3 [Symbiodinium natans]|uniref:AFC3 protein n=1 Tax=Symbiodinium natans TaxID=878477 RepID=A0A812NP57_9DINO|nr:AFC3 [Symbiodinium natans]